MRTLESMLLDEGNGESCVCTISCCSDLTTRIIQLEKENSSMRLDHEKEVQQYKKALSNAGDQIILFQNKIEELEADNRSKDSKDN